LREGAERCAFNTIIQGTAAEFTNASLGKIQRWLDETKSTAKLVLTVYDSIMLEVDEADQWDVAEEVRTIMESWPSMGVPIIAEMKAGRRWGELHAL